MSRFSCFMVLVALAGLAVPARELVAVVPQAPASARALAEARAASGGAELKSFRLKARLKGGPLSSFPTEVTALWPNHYLQRVQMKNSEHVTGASGRTLLYEFPKPSPEFPNPPTEAELVRLQQEELAVWTLLLFARTDTAIRLTPDAAVSAASESSVVTMRGAGGLTIRVTLDRASRVPIRTERTLQLRAMSGQLLGQSAQHVNAASGRRMVGGVSVPAGITSTRDGEVQGELIVETLEVDPPLTVRDFAPPTARSR